MTSERERPEDKLEHALSAEHADRVNEFPIADADDLHALRATAGELRVLRAAVPASKGDAAFATMLGGLESARTGQQTGVVGAAIVGWWNHPVLRAGVTATAAILLLGGAGLGAAAATGSEPARTLLGISTSSAIKVEFTGTVISVNGPVVEVGVDGDIRIVTIDESTDLKAGDDTPLPLDGILAGQVVEVRGHLQPDNSILATSFRVEDDSNTIGGTPTVEAPTQTVPTVEGTAPVPSAEATAFVPTAPAAQPTVDDENRGHGNDDDGDDEDNPGQGNGIGPDGERDGDGDGEGEDDNSGHGNDDDGEDEDNPGRQGGSDDDDEGDGDEDERGDDD